MKIIALIPARSGSKRIKNKNIKDFCGYPLIAYTIQQAKDAGCFDSIIVSSNDADARKIAFDAGVDMINRPENISRDSSTDYEWVNHALVCYPEDAIYCILRPTSPFRRVATIIWGIHLLKENKNVDSVRAIKSISEHPLKMWKYHKFDDGSGRITPLLPIIEDHGTKSYDLPTQSFSMAWIQTGGLQVGWTKNIKNGDISGNRIMGIMQHWPEYIDLNTNEDWEYAEWLVKAGKAQLPQIVESAR